MQIQQVLVNLGRNAIEAFSDHAQSEREISIKTQLLEDATMLVSVSDNGPGLADHVKMELFSPNITTKEPGMGLGLSICQTIIEAQDGKLRYADENRPGATFCFTIPVVNPEIK